jgi:ORF6N domain
MSKTELMLAPDIERLIHTARSRRVILDTDLARLYGVPTKRLNEQYRRNIDRFPEDFAFQLTPKEWAVLRSQIAVLAPVENLRSQNATSRGHGGRRYVPAVFTEHGALMAANILNSPRAVAMSVSFLLH